MVTGNFQGMTPKGHKIRRGQASNGRNREADPSPLPDWFGKQGTRICLAQAGGGMVVVMTIAIRYPQVERVSRQL